MYEFNKFLEKERKLPNLKIKQRRNNSYSIGLDSSFLWNNFNSLTF